MKNLSKKSQYYNKQFSENAKRGMNWCAVSSLWESKLIRSDVYSIDSIQKYIVLIRSLVFNTFRNFHNDKNNCYFMIFNNIPIKMTLLNGDGKDLNPSHNRPQSIRLTLTTHNVNRFTWVYASICQIVFEINWLAILIFSIYTLCNLYEGYYILYGLCNQ